MEKEITGELSYVNYVSLNEKETLIKICHAEKFKKVFQVKNEAIGRICKVKNRFG